MAYKKSLDRQHVIVVVQMCWALWNQGRLPVLHDVYVLPGFPFLAQEAAGKMAIPRQFWGHEGLPRGRRFLYAIDCDSPLEGKRCRPTQSW